MMRVFILFLFMIKGYVFLSQDIGCFSADELKNKKGFYSNLSNIDTLNYDDVLRLDIVKPSYLYDFPNIIGKLNRLHYLDMFHDSISIVSIDLSELPCLNRVRLRSINLKQFPNELSYSKSIKLLDLSDNRLNSIDSNIFRNNSMEVIDLSNQKDVIEMKYKGTSLSLVKLNLSNNQLVLGEDFLSFSFLEELNLKNCSLEKVDFSKLPNLKHLDLSNNNIKEISKSLSNTNLISLNLSGNLLIKLPDEIIKMKNLKTLYLGDCFPDLSIDKLIEMAEKISVENPNLNVHW